jgi:LacI family transcriptional regulator
MPTLKDVANRAGVGLATASRVISGSGSVSLATAARVMAAIQELGYRPSSIGRAMVTGRMDTLGLFVPDYSEGEVRIILDEAIREIRASNRNVIVTSGSVQGDSDQQAVAAVRELIERGCDGVLVVAHCLGQDALAEIAACGERVVFVKQSFVHNPDVSFHIDHRVGGAIAAEYLAGLGHRRIAFVSDAPEIWGNAAKLEGFEIRLRELCGDSITIEPYRCPSSYPGGHEAAESVVKSGFNATALFCTDDSLAVGALAGLNSLGLTVPGDMSVLGYGDSYAARYSSPLLSTVSVPIGRFARQAARSLLYRCYGTKSDSDSEVSLALVARHTCRAVCRQS